MIYLRKNGKRSYHSVHRLVAKAFIPNPKELPFVNHKNEKKADNRATNLEWCDAKYNTNYGTCIKRRARAQTNRHGAISVIQYSLHGDMIAEYPSLMEASRKSNVPVRAICACCKNYQNHLMDMYGNIKTRGRNNKYVLYLCGNIKRFGEVSDLRLFDSGNGKWAVFSNGRQLTNVRF